MIFPAIFYHMPERVSCLGSMETGADIAAGDGQTRYVTSIAKLLNVSGELVGWLYLADYQGKKQARYVQATPAMRASALRSLGLRMLPSGKVSSVAIFHGALPDGIRAVRCYDITQNGND